MILPIVISIRDITIDCLVKGLSLNKVIFTLFV